MSTTTIHKQGSSAKTAQLPLQKKKKNRSSKTTQILLPSTQHTSPTHQRESLSDWNHAS